MPAGGLNNFGPTFDDANQSDVNKRTKGLTGLTAIEPDVTDRIDPLREPSKFFLRNELVLGRFAMTGECVLGCLTVVQRPWIRKNGNVVTKDITSN